MSLPAAQSTGTILVWMIRTQPETEPSRVGETSPDVNSTRGYKFELIWQEDHHLVIKGSIVQDRAPVIPLSGRSQFTSLHYDGTSRTYTFNVRVYGDQIDSCFTDENNITDVKDRSSSKSGELTTSQPATAA